MNGTAQAVPLFIGFPPPPPLPDDRTTPSLMAGAMGVVFLTSIHIRGKPQSLGSYTTAGQAVSRVGKGVDV